MQSERELSALEPRPAAVEPASSPPRGRVRRTLGPVAVVLLTAGALVQPLATALARLDWRIELFSHFQLLGLSVTLSALAAAAWRRRRLAVALGALALFQAIPLFHYTGPNPVPPDPHVSGRLRLLMANVLVDNASYDELARVIRSEHPDVVGLVEFTPEWREGLADVREEYPYRVEAPWGTRGLALWFRKAPLKTDPPARLLAGGWPFVHAEVEFAGESRHLWLVHPQSPLSRRGLPEPAALADRVWSTGGSRIVMGDINSSEGSPFFADFLHDSGLRDSRLGFGRQPSWPAGWPFAIAIDHAFVTGDLAVADRRLGPEIGSDHYPLILDLAPADPSRIVSSSSSSQAK